MHKHDKIISICAVVLVAIVGGAYITDKKKEVERKSRRPAVITGRIVDETGAPLSGAKVIFWLSSTWFQFVPPLIRGEQTTMAAQTAGDGTFAFRFSHDDAYVFSVRHGTQSLAYTVNLATNVTSSSEYRVRWLISDSPVKRSNVQITVRTRPKVDEEFRSL